MAGRVEDGRQHSWLNLLDCDNAAFLACADRSSPRENQRDAIHHGQLITFLVHTRNLFTISLENVVV
uniref:Uncharacterized protein n=1 Tax=Timema douglasi TaxID=61478 RepID=A0A7R8Z5K8_TIMDO|nr:unnamed protein product [Timema douglasi]